MFLTRLFEQRSRADYLQNWFSGEDLDGALTAFSGEAVSPGSALRLSAVFRCANILSDDVSKLPLHIFKSSPDGDRTLDANHPAYRLLSIAPNEAMTPLVFWKLLEIKRELWGNAYAYVRLDYNGYPTELLPLPPEYVLPWIDSAGRLWYLVNLPGLEPTRVDASLMIHLKGFSTDGITGRSILQYARETIGAGQAEQRFEGTFYARGMKLGGVLETPSKITPEDKNKLRTEFESMTSGLNNMHRVAILQMGEKFTPLSMPMKDAQFVETKTMNIRDIARFWGLPLYKLQEGKESYASNEMQDIDYLKNTLDPLLVQNEQELRLKLFTPNEQKRRYVRYNRSAQLRAESKSRAEYLKLMVLAGIYTINEARAYEEMNRYEPGGENPADRLMFSLNYTTLENLEQNKTGKPPEESKDKDVPADLLAEKPENDSLEGGMDEDGEGDQDAGAAAGSTRRGRRKAQDRRVRGEVGTAQQPHLWVMD